MNITTFILVYHYLCDSGKIRVISRSFPTSRQARELFVQRTLDKHVCRATLYRYDVDKYTTICSVISEYSTMYW